MPTILRQRGYRLFFWSADCNEKQHIHIEKAEKIAKFWLIPVELQENHGYNTREINEIIRIIEENHQYILDRWEEHCGDR